MAMHVQWTQNWVVMDLNLNSSIHTCFAKMVNLNAKFAKTTCEKYLKKIIILIIYWIQKKR